VKLLKHVFLHLGTSAPVYPTGCAFQTIFSGLSYKLLPILQPASADHRFQYYED